MMPGMNPRQMNKMMQKMGIKQDEIEASEVIIKTPEKNLIIKNPSVTKVDMMGQKTFQIIGEVTEESSILNFPAVMIRDSHERPEGMDEGTLIMSGLKKDNVIRAINIVKSFDYNKRTFNIVKDYDVENFSKKIIKIVLSYIDYVNCTVWYKNI